MAIEAIGANYVGMQHVQNHNLKSAQSFTSKPEFDEEKSNASKLMLGATALAAVVGLGIAGYKGKLGKGVQEFLGGTKKAAENLTETTEKAAKKVEKDVSNSLNNNTEKVVEKEVKKTSEKTTHKAPKEVEHTTSKISEEIDKFNEHLKKYGVDGKAFIDNNNPEQVVVITRNKDGYYKQVQLAKDFKFTNNTYLDSDKNISQVVTDTRLKANQSATKFAPNGVKTTIKRKNGTVHTEIKTPDYYTFFRTSKGNKIVSETILCDKYTLKSGDPNFEDVKKSFFAVKLKEGLN